MEPNTRFTIMTFPQSYDGDKTISLNILVLPRNQNPFSNPMEEVPGLPAFVDAQLTFKAKTIAGTDLFPNDKNFTREDVLTTSAPGNKSTLFTSLADPKHFDILQKDLLNTKVNIAGHPDKPADAKPKEFTIKKYLPETYRKAFNFIAPLMPGNGVTDDSYHCAVKAAEYKPGFKQSPDKISWGKVFAYILRNRVLAEEAGFIYHADLKISVADFKDGGWIHIDLADGSDYKAQTLADNDFIKKYAARIPALKAGKDRSLFAANLFPVLKKTGLVDPTPGVGFDNIFIEASDYDDGFTKIVHAFQPVSQNLLAELSDGFHPTNESGIRLGWDDEQILAWYVRQMAEDPNNPGKRMDAPAGVFGYRIDVRKNKSGDDWESLNEVKTRDGINLLADLVPDADGDGTFSGELPFQVYPATLDGDLTKNYWLPMYFANWNGHSMVLPDEEAIKIYQNDQDVKPDFNAADPDKKGKTNVTGAPKNELLRVYEPALLNTRLKYGDEYDFRIRMMDMTHGGPVRGREPFNEAITPNGYCHFKRYVAPSAIRIEGIPHNDDGAVYSLPTLDVQRPLLSYPAVAFCSGYADPVGRLSIQLQNQLADARAKKLADPLFKGVQMDAIGLADPNVDSIEITVEVQALKMDYQLSISGKDNFAFLYKTIRKFNVPVNDEGYDDTLSISIHFQEAHVLKFGDSTDLGDLSFDPSAEDGDIELPKARMIRITLRAVCEPRPGYYGLEKDDPAFNTRYGRTSYVTLYEPSVNEADLFITKSIEAIYLQPDDVPLGKNIIPHLQKIHAQPAMVPNCVQRLAQQLKIGNNELSLVGNAGQRIQFGCSARIRHTLAPDNSALTFASKAELYHHWLCCIKLDIDRDWTWDALEDTSFIIKRKTNFKETPGIFKEQVVGEIDVKHTISFGALQNADRSHTTILFVDAIEPKKEQGIDPDTFPDVLEVSYSVTPVFKKDHGASNDGDAIFETMQLPITINPTQIPKIASAGIALSPYHRSEKYASTEPRQRFLWIEFAEPVHDPNDLYFARVLAYSPDQLISNNNHYMEKPVTEPPLNIDPEYMRVIVPGSSDDNAGINAMQPMEKSTRSDKHYLLPLPPGLNESSAELFGFFTYELRVGHASAKRKLWSTAQGRFGRPLKATGIQHPAPTLTCAVNRDEEKLYVTSPYATAVFNGKNVTANPPHTELWCLLYAQVKQADNNDADKKLKDFRNILLDDRMMHWGYQLNHDPAGDAIGVIDHPEFNHVNLGIGISKQMIIDKLGLSATNSKYINLISPAELATKNADATKYGTTFWTNGEVDELLKAYGLPVDLDLSVLCVEIFTNITSEQQYRTRTLRTDAANAGAFNDGAHLDAAGRGRKPLSDALGNYRILRTSPLCEVPYVCCT